MATASSVKLASTPLSGSPLVSASRPSSRPAFSDETDLMTLLHDTSQHTVPQHGPTYYCP